MTVRFLRPSYFIWLVVPASVLAGLYLVANIWGLPHVVWSYAWIDDGREYGSFSTRTYTRCTYVGPYGSIAFQPLDGRCGWLRFVRQTREGG